MSIGTQSSHSISPEVEGSTQVLFYEASQNTILERVFLPTCGFNASYSALPRAATFSERGHEFANESKHVSNSNLQSMRPDLVFSLHKDYQGTIRT